MWFSPYLSPVEFQLPFRHLPPHILYHLPHHFEKLKYAYIVVADMEVDMVADMGVDKVANKVADMVAEIF